MLVPVNFELAYILSQIAEANENIDNAKSDLAKEATRGANYKGSWAKINRARRRNRIQYANMVIAENEELIAKLQRKVDAMVEQQSTNFVGVPASVEEAEANIKNDPELLAFLLS
jgi:uncharacterized coiled-coil protein SlyX